MPNVESVCEAVLKRVTPKKREVNRIEASARELEERVASAAAESNVKAKVRVEGSVAKNTWLSGEPDIDVFMRVPRSIPRKSLGDVCLRIARKATAGAEQIERFADHPYLEAIVDGTRVNIVPCYDVKRGDWLSATDRTPYHSDYVRKRLGEKLRGEVRLLKRFMKGVGVYGAEIKVGGFSGYLCELLVLHFGSFLGTLQAFAHHRTRIVVDIEDYYARRERELMLLFDEPLVVVDPVDKARNVGSAVRIQKLHAFVVAARLFLKKPSIEFFYPPETKALNSSELIGTLKERGSTVVFLTFGSVDVVPDVLWGQLYRSQRSLCKLIELSDFILLRERAWSDEKALNVFVFELEQRFVSSVKKHLGPPLDKENECGIFVSKYLGSKEVVCGPYIENGRWVVLVRRRFIDACDLLREKLKDGGRNAGVAEGISWVLKRDFQVLVNDEIIGVYEGNDEFAVFLTEFLQGRPRWLKAHSV